MVIRKKRIRSIEKNIRGLTRGAHLVVGLKSLARFEEVLSSIGFSETPKVGEAVLPSPVGPVSRFNAEGYYEVRKDLPMETAYRQAEWTWKEFRGRYETVEKSKIVEIPYQRYPRKFIPPPSVELSVKLLTSGESVLVSPVIEFAERNDGSLVHAVNLFLEIFGECEILNQDLSPLVDARVVRLNWEVLPKGSLPWAQLQPHLQRVVGRQPEGVQKVINKRYESINFYGPEFLAIGRAGFDGYIVFGFPSKSLFILESTEINNATYVLDRDWEVLSTMTKAELLNDHLHKERLIHRANWFWALQRLLGKHAQGG